MDVTITEPKWAYVIHNLIFIGVAVFSDLLWHLAYAGIGSEDVFPQPGYSAGLILHGLIISRLNLLILHENRKNV
jgi:hypothetical protein